MSRVIVKDLPKNLKAEELKKHFAGIDTITESSLRFTESGVFRRFAFVGFKSQDSGAKAVEQLDNTYIGMSKIKVELAKNWQEIKSQSSTSKKKTFKGNKAKTKYKNNDAPSEDLILQTGRLFLRNLPYDCKAEDIEALFSNYGKSEVHLVINRVLKTSVGTGFVNFLAPEEAMKAYKELDGIDFQGRLLHIMPAHPKQETPAEAAVWKKKKEETKKPKAHKWNTLFVSSNATADVIAERLKISKSDLLLKPGNSSVAARIAVGESQIVSEIKEFLLENGVALDSFGEADGPRSKTVILVKHLNAFTTADSLRTIFERYGTIVRLVLPPCGMSALIEFVEPSEAKFAFEKLDMTTVDHMIMYLEWAPMNVFSKPAQVEGENTNDEQMEDGETKTSKSADNKELKTKEKKDGQNKATKFIIKNVDFRATRKDISLLFKAYQGLESVRLPKKLPGSGPERHRGFAFVEFLTAEQAEAAFKDLCQDTHLYKRRLVFEWTSGDESVTLLRKRTADHYTGESKKFKKNDLISELDTNA